jgi:hypothetical protein
VIHNTGGAWAEVLQPCINEVWRNTWPDAVTDFHGFVPEEEIDNSRCATVHLARTVGFEDVDEANVEELLQSHMEGHSNANILELEKELNDDDNESPYVKPVKHLSTKQLTELLSKLSQPMASYMIMITGENCQSYQSR